MYKFAPVNEYSLLNFENGQLYLNHHSYFNDAFECSCEIFSGFPKLDDGSGRLIEVIKAWGFDDPDDPLVREHYQDYTESLEDGEPCIEYFIDSARIGCFSSDALNQLMWAHYADGLRGFCIEFDRDFVIPEERDARVYDVLYCDRPAVIDASVLAVLYDQRDYHEDAYFDVGNLAKYHGVDRSAEINMYDECFRQACDDIRAIYQKMLATKPVPWAYESEMRIIDFGPREDQCGVFMPYPREAVKSLTFGEKILGRHQDKLIEIAQSLYPTISLKRAVKVPGSFALELVDL